MSAEPAEELILDLLLAHLGVEIAAEAIELRRDAATHPEDLQQQLQTNDEEKDEP
jgi:hypothetical protein